MRRDALQDAVIGLALFALAFWHFLAFVQREEMHRDEARWTHRSYFLEELFHPSADLWRTDTILTMGQPPLGNYLMGVGLLLQGHELKPNGFYDFDHKEAWNRARGNVPSDDVLHAARRTNAVVGALTVLCVFFIGRRLANRVAGVAGALLLIPHPLNTYLSTFAGSDALLVFLVAAAALAAILLADKPTWPRAIALGLLIGLGGATKLSPILISLPLAALGLALVLYGVPARLKRAERRRGGGAVGDDSSVPPSAPAALSGLTAPPPLRPSAPSDLGWMLLTVPVVAFAAFVLVYPYLWPDPASRTDLLFDFRTAEMKNQSELWEQTSVSGPFEAIDRVEIQLGDRTSTAGWLSVEIEERFGRTFDRPDLDLKLGTLGLVLLAGWALMYGPRSRYTLAGLVIGGEAALIVGGMQVDFERYHLPILLAIVVGAGFLAGQLWNGVVLSSSGARFAVAYLRARRPALAPIAPDPVSTDRDRDRLPDFEDPRPSARPATTHGLATSARMVGPGRIQPLLVAAALGLGVLIGHSWAGLRTIARPDKPED